MFTLLAIAVVSSGPWAYPLAPRNAVIDDYHGTRVADPYRWLEDPDSNATRAWIDAQNKLTDAYFATLTERTAIKDRLTALWNFERFGLPTRAGKNLFFSKNDGLQNQSVLYVADGNNAPRALLDPNTLSADGTVALSSYEPSVDGKLLAYGLADSGSDWITWHVRDVAAGTDLPDVIKWNKWSGIAWTPDGQGFFYSRYDEPKAGNEYEDVNYFQKVFYHRLGTTQAADELVYHRPDEKEWGFDATVTDDGRYLLVHVWKGTDDTSLVYYKELKQPHSAIKPLIGNWEAAYNFIDNDGSLFYFMTNKDAPRRRVIAIDVRTPAREKWRNVIPESNETLDEIDLVGDSFIAAYLKDARSELRVFKRDGAFLHNIVLPDLGTASIADAGRADKDTFLSYTSFTHPTAIYRYDVAGNTSTVFRAAKAAFDPAAYETEQVFYKSYDGTRAPLFIVHKKGIVRDGSHPTLLYGYGGFNISITPDFSAARIAWLELGGVYAVATLRGGGEYGEAWHQGGTKLHKQNVFDDFMSAAEFLVAERYTSASKLAITGRSNGGLLAGACLTQRPDLFAAVVPQVGVLDMLRFHKFTIGWAWVDDYGSADSAEEFFALQAYSPLHNVIPGAHYPATLVTTGDHDDRVVPGHSFKFAAALQHAQGGQAPILIRIDTKAGHGAGKPTDKQIDEVADIYAFLRASLGAATPAAMQASR